MALMKHYFSRIVVKVGSNVLARPDGTPDVTRMSALVDQIAGLRRMGIEVILVSSGAVASGRSELHPVRKLDCVDQRQLFSAVGQVKLINRYYELFREYGITVAQVLTMKESFATRRHYLNQKNCMAVMLENGVLPVVNENDTIAVSELMFTDNDELSGLIASMMDAQALLILTNVDGIYDGPLSLPSSQVIREIRSGEDISGCIQTARSGFGRGGMLTKTGIARKVADEGIAVFIANGRRENVLTEILKYEALRMEQNAPALPDPPFAYTRFVPAARSVSGVKKWIAHSEGFAKGAIYLNSQAAELLLSDKAVSVLPVGVVAVGGEFEKDDIVRILHADGTPIGVGKTNFSSAEVREAAGKHGKKPVVHYDYLYME